MSKRSVRKIRHLHPTPSVKNRVASGKTIEDGGDAIHLMDIWRSNNPRHLPFYQEKMDAIISVSEEENGG